MPAKPRKRGYHPDVHPLQQPLEIGKVYPNWWGVPFEVWGHAHTDGKPDKTKVYTSADHLDIRTGVGSRNQLINLPREVEIEFFRGVLATIHKNNHPDNLRLVADKLWYIENHIAELNDLNWVRRTTRPELPLKLVK